VSAGLPHVLKIADVKYYECPVSAIKPKTWELMRIVNETALGENMEHLYPPESGTVLGQPPWWRDAVRIVRNGRAEHRAREMDKLKQDRK